MTLYLICDFSGNIAKRPRLFKDYQSICFLYRLEDSIDVKWADCTQVRAFAKGARDSKAVGFDAVEIHGAHGYLLDQFFWEGTNQRDDTYGGSMANRGKFVAEIVAACRAEVGPDFPIILRWSQWKQQDYTARLATTAAALAYFLAPLVDAGVDIFRCRQRRFW